MRVRQGEQSRQEYFLKDFDLNYTLNCGQVFRWKFTGSEWVGIVENSLVRARQSRSRLTVSTDLSPEAISNYFRFDDDLEEIYQGISRDQHMQRAVEMYRGLRLVRQNPWECLISYLCSSASNIPRIKNVIESICKSYGSEIGWGYHAFPDPERLSRAAEGELRSCGLGFRAPFVIGAAKAIEAGDLNLNRLKAKEYADAKEELKTIKGVGDKIADCVLLFSCDKLEAFPVDTHIKQYMQQIYFNSNRVPEERIRKFAGEYFGRYCGYAQQYIYIHQRGCVYEVR